MKKIVFIRRSHSKFISIIFYFFYRASISAAVLYHQFLSDRPTKRRRTHRDEDGTFSSHSVALVINLITRAHRVTILLQRAIVPPLIAPHQETFTFDIVWALARRRIQFKCQLNELPNRIVNWIELITGPEEEEKREMRYTWTTVFNKRDSMVW